MGKKQELREIFEPPEEIVQAGLNGDLVFFVGSGASMLLGLPSWKDLAAKAFEDLQSKGFLEEEESNQLKKLDPKQQLSIAYLIADDNKHQLDLVQHLTCESEGNSIYKAINDIGCPCVTTNYDELLAPRYIDAKGCSIADELVNRVYDRNKFFAKLLNEPGTVIHLHGAISEPETMIVTTKEYLEHYAHENVQEFLGELFRKKTILFLGYGLGEAEVLEHILRKGAVGRNRDRRRFALQSYRLDQKSLYKRLYGYYEKSFGVHLLGVIRHNEDYSCLEKIMKYWVSQIEVRKPLLADDYEFMNEVLGCE